MGDVPVALTDVENQDIAVCYRCLKWVPLNIFRPGQLWQGLAAFPQKLSLRLPVITTAARLRLSYRSERKHRLYVFERTNPGEYDVLELLLARES